MKTQILIMRRNNQVVRKTLRKPPQNTYLFENNTYLIHDDSIYQVHGRFGTMNLIILREGNLSALTSKEVSLQRIQDWITGIKEDDTITKFLNLKKLDSTIIVIILLGVFMALFLGIIIGIGIATHGSFSVLGGA